MHQPDKHGSFHRLAWFRRAQVSDFKAEATRHGFKIEKVRVVLDSALLESERLDVEVAEKRPTQNFPVKRVIQPRYL